MAGSCCTATASRSDRFPSVRRRAKVGGVVRPPLSSAESVPPLDRFRWVEIVEGHFDYVYWTLRRFGASETDAEDLCQEVFLAMWRRRSAYDPERPLRPWLAGIAYRVKQEHRRRWAREVTMDFVDQTDEAPLPDERLEALGAQALVLEALARLPERQRT